MVQEVPQSYGEPLKAHPDKHPDDSQAATRKK